jgi:hypothetical protein
VQMGKDDSTVCKSGGMMTAHTVGNDGSAHCAKVRGMMNTHIVRTYGLKDRADGANV